VGEKATRFEEIVAWQRARELARDIYALTRTRDFDRDFSLARQMQRAAVSVMANVAEGFDRHGSTEFHRFVTISRGSCSELRSHLYVALDVGYIASDEFERLFALASEVDRLLRALRASLERSRDHEP